VSTLFHAALGISCWLNKPMEHVWYDTSSRRHHCHTVQLCHNAPCTTMEQTQKACLTVKDHTYLAVHLVHGVIRMTCSPHHGKVASATELRHHQKTHRFDIVLHVYIMAGVSSIPYMGFSPSRP
jgi:hypothetical protein